MTTTMKIYVVHQPNWSCCHGSGFVGEHPAESPADAVRSAIGGARVGFRIANAGGYDHELRDSEILDIQAAEGKFTAIVEFERYDSYQPDRKVVKDRRVLRGTYESDRGL